MPMLRLNDALGYRHERVLEGQLVSFGRSADNDLVLEARGVSRRHGRFCRDEEGRWWVEDLGSRNGTLVAGQPVGRHPLAPGDVITVGDLQLTYCDDDEPRPADTLPAVTISDLPGSVQATTERRADAVRAMDSRRLTALYEISRRLMVQRDVSGLIEVASSALTTALGAEVVVFGMTRDPEREPEQLVVRATGVAETGVTLSRSVLRRTLEGRQAVLVADTRLDGALDQAHSIVAGGIRSALCVPMMREQEATGFIYVDSRRSGRSYGEPDLDFACAIGAMVGTAIENARLHEAELVKQRLEAEFGAARRVQQAILPSRWPQLPGWEIAGLHESCHEVGGDYYDAVVTEAGRLWLLIADVAGKGAPAALRASAVHAAFHAILDACPSPARLLHRLNELLLRRELESSFVTCLAAMITPESGDIVLASGGHPAPLYVSGQEAPRPVPLPANFVVGSWADAAYEEMSWRFPAGPGSLVLYTDGVSEAFNEADELFGEERIRAALAGRGERSARELVDDLAAAVQDFRGSRPQSDDLTLMVCRKTAAE